MCEHVCGQLGALAHVNDTVGVSAIRAGYFFKYVIANTIASLLCEVCDRYHNNISVDHLF